MNSDMPHAHNDNRTPAIDPTINGLMERFGTDLGMLVQGDPLTVRLPLVSIWGTLLQLTGDETSYCDAVRLVLDCRDAPATVRPLSTAGSVVVGAFSALLDTLLAEEIPAPLFESFTVGLVWADLCELTGEEPPACVLALLELPVVA